MKELFGYIKEARGVVTGENNWSNLVNYIVKNCKFDDENEFTIYQREYLPPWMGSCVLRLNKWIHNGIAFYNDGESILIGNQMEVTIEVTKNALTNTNKFRITLEHELQHAFDHWIKVFRRGKTSFMDNNYDIPVGFESPDYNKIRFWDIYNNKGKCYFDHMFYLLNGSTYWFDQSEINAFLREFSLYLKEVSIKNNELNWKELYYNPNESGAQPLIGIMLIYEVINNPNKFPNMEWDYVMDSLNVSWAKQYLGHTFSGRDAKSFCNVLREILMKKAKNILTRYKRVVKDSGVNIINAPEWF